MLARGIRAYAYLLIATLACSAPYILVQPTLRYRYLVSSLLIFLALDGLGRLAVRYRQHAVIMAARKVAPP